MSDRFVINVSRRLRGLNNRYHEELFLTFLEPNSFHHLNSSLNVTAESLGEDFFQLSQILNQFPKIKGSVLTGPSTTQLNKKPTIKYFTE